MIEQRNGRFRARIRINGQPALSRTFTSHAAAQKWHDHITDSAKTAP